MKRRETVRSIATHRDASASIDHRRPWLSRASHADRLNRAIGSVRIATGIRAATGPRGRPVRDRLFPCAHLSGKRCPSPRDHVSISRSEATTDRRSRSVLHVRSPPRDDTSYLSASVRINDSRGFAVLSLYMGGYTSTTVNDGSAAGSNPIRMYLCK